MLIADMLLNKRCSFEELFALFASELAFILNCNVRLADLGQLTTTLRVNGVSIIRESKSNEAYSCAFSPP
jgi:hypothetical protein